ncbi:Insecticidal toxin complex protein [Cellulophaga sp. 20_2_10]|uniref:Insecticidal toxin complex protein n=1 Tax=Cellulophaga sp. 20_2_10 TaxID=2942476 RepID=UPI00201A7ABC|nr:Insecticidal toxin complex protein [Cellulophaga sp. 20_2_10]MCL5246027.1 Insecticidal toxin complex protein [Cellulophaga sp. 20_2_10]
MRYFFTLTLFLFFFEGSAAEWKNLKEYEQQTGKTTFAPQDWLTQDRLKNTSVWQEANSFNLENNLFLEYQTIVERRDFYKWYALSVEEKGHKVVWPRMAHFISSKLSLTTRFPYNIVARKDVVLLSKKGSKKVFNSAFPSMLKLYTRSKTLTKAESLAWDKDILYKEQYLWIENIYAEMNIKTLKRLERIAKGKFLYGLVVPNTIRFKGDLTNPKDRYAYATETLRKHCKNSYW